MPVHPHTHTFSFYICPDVSTQPHVAKDKSWSHSYASPTVGEHNSWIMRRNQPLSLQLLLVRYLVTVKREVRKMDMEAMCTDNQ